MKLLIQLNFDNLGNFYIATTQILVFANFYKKKGYECNLVFASTSNGRNGYGIFDIQFEEIFDKKYFDVFDNIKTIQKSITEKHFDGYVCQTSENPGGQWWDAFFQGEIKDVHKLKSHHDSQAFNRDSDLPKVLPKFNEKVYQKVQEYKNQNPQVDSSIQLRLYGYGDKENFNETLKKVYDELYENVKKSKKNFYLTSSCVSCLGKIIDLPNVFLIEGRKMYENFGDIDFYEIKGGRNQQLDYLYNTIAEMVLIGETNDVFYYSIHWPSTFMYYGFVHNQNIKIQHINTIN